MEQEIAPGRAGIAEAAVAELLFARPGMLMKRVPLPLILHQVVLGCPGLRVVERVVREDGLPVVGPQQ